MRVVPQYNVAFSALQGGGVIFRATNNSDGTLPALGPQLGSIVAGRPPTVLTAWLVRGGKDPAVLDRLAMPADLGSKAAWDAVIDLGETVLEPGDVLVVRLEVPDSSGAPQATEPGVFRVETATTGAGDGQGDGAGQGGDDGEARAGSGDDPIHLAQLDADDPLALAATALIPAPPDAQAMVAAGAGVTP
jgi:hypothetical protein